MTADVSSSRPHIILVSTDQQRADTLACLGHGHPITPNLDAMAGHGVAAGRIACWKNGDTKVGD